MKQILKALVGSRAYGTNSPNSDCDWIQVEVRKPSYYLGIDRHDKRPSSSTQQEDNTYCELLHFINMCCKFNPNIIVALWSPQVDTDPNWHWLVNQRRLFSSKLAVRTFMGFATSQMEQAGAKGSTGQLGAKRKELIEKYGYDTKFAMHSIRVATMIAEFLEEDGQFLRVGRWDWERLLSIRNGEFSLDYVKDWFATIKTKIQSLEAISTIPELPDYDTINQLTVESMKRELL